ncbi:hypothetical protein OsJ_30825 [Oryza sativa Japonica Group]|uniref:Uncharacterized protein n=1 Tax=Oryza sativa subsp. japonica TaxID=39947 RepID=B9G7N7_ORYSJ|nr:hypothetical protein OsJ_30825 [Oryza sativa Japonica Group]
MSGRLRHRPQPQSEGSSRQTGSASSAQAGNGGSSPTNVEDDESNTRARTGCGDRLEEADCPRIVPAGDAFEVYPYISSRRPSTVQGALLRKFYPGAFGLVECRTPALTWRDYKRSTNERIMSPADRVLKEFWYCFKCDPTDKVEADKVLEQNFKKKVPQVLFEEKKRATNKLYKKGKQHTKGGQQGLAAAWQHTHRMQQGKNEQLCNQRAEEAWGCLSRGMEREYGPNWQVEKPDLDANVIYNSTGRMPHGRLAIANEAISNKDKDAIKSRKRAVTPPPSRVSAREIYQQKKIKCLERDNASYRGLECVVRALAAKGGLDYETLVRQYAPELASSTKDVGSAPDHHEAEYQHDQSDVDQEGGNDIGEDEGNDFDLEEGNEIPEYEDNDFDLGEGNEIPEGEGNGDDTDGDYGMSESDHEDIDLWII